MQFEWPPNLAPQPTAVGRCKRFVAPTLGSGRCTSATAKASMSELHFSWRCHNEACGSAPLARTSAQRKSKGPG
jgi:hypothetical protein